MGNNAYQPALAILGWSTLPFRLADHTDNQVAAMLAEDDGPERLAAELRRQQGGWESEDEDSDLPPLVGETSTKAQGPAQ